MVHITKNDLMKLPLNKASVLALNMPDSSSFLEFSENRTVCDAVLHDAERCCRAWGVDKERVIILTWLGRTLFTVHADRVQVTFVPGELVSDCEALEWWFQTIWFWVDKGYLKPLSILLRNNSELQSSFDQIFMGQMDD